MLKWFQLKSSDSFNSTNLTQNRKNTIEDQIINSGSGNQLNLNLLSNKSLLLAMIAKYGFAIVVPGIIVVSIDKIAQFSVDDLLIMIHVNHDKHWIKLIHFGESFV